MLHTRIVHIFFPSENFSKWSHLTNIFLNMFSWKIEGYARQCSMVDAVEIRTTSRPKVNASELASNIHLPDGNFTSNDLNKPLQTSSLQRFQQISLFNGATAQAYIDIGHYVVWEFRLYEYLWKYTIGEVSHNRRRVYNRFDMLLKCLCQRTA